MKLKGEPHKPKRKEVYDTFYLSDGDNLQSIANHFEGEDLSEVYVDIEQAYDDCSVCLRLNRKETNEEFAVRVAKYKKLLVSYEKWYTKNKDAIIEEKHKRIVVAKEKLCKATVKEEKRLKKMRAALEKKIEKLRL